jgi:hypothetical protein
MVVGDALDVAGSRAQEGAPSPRSDLQANGCNVSAMPSFEHTRSIVIAAPPAAVHALVDDLHAWTKWSPWEGLDADLNRTYSGSEKGVGARYAWAGKKSGEGSMHVTGATSDRIDLDLDFDKGLAKLKVVAEA